MIAVLSVALGIAVVVMVVLISLMGWGGPVGRVQRISLLVAATGLTWAGPARLFGHPPGAGDLMFVGGIVVHLATVYGPAIWRRAAALDGVDDGRLEWLPARLQSAVAWLASLYLRAVNRGS